MITDDEVVEAIFQNIAAKPEQWWITQGIHTDPLLHIGQEFINDNEDVATCSGYYVHNGPQCFVSAVRAVMYAVRTQFFQFVMTTKVGGDFWINAPGDTATVMHKRLMETINIALVKRERWKENQAAQREEDRQQAISMIMDVLKL